MSALRDFDGAPQPIHLGLFAEPQKSAREPEVSR
jgi:hypothetical protein